MNTAPRFGSEKDLPKEYREALESNAPNPQVAREWGVTPQAVGYWRRKLFPGRKWPNSRNCRPPRPKEAPVEPEEVDVVEEELPSSPIARQMLNEIQRFNQTWLSLVRESRRLRSWYQGGAF